MQMLSNANVKQSYQSIRLYCLDTLISVKARKWSAMSNAIMYGGLKCITERLKRGRLSAYLLAPVYMYHHVSPSASFETLTYKKRSDDDVQYERSMSIILLARAQGLECCFLGCIAIDSTISKSVMI